MRRRTWRWLSLRIIHLLSTESRLQRKLNPPKKPDTPKARGRQ